MLGAGALTFAGQAATQSRGVSAVADAGAAADGQRQLHALPRHALVIGNSQYQDAPLRNPANDAAAIAGELKQAGFEVVQALDAGRTAMLDAIQAFGGSLGQQGAVGLFYFAGHGVQLAWRNYLIPVDAVVDNPEDVRERAVELNTLLQGLTRAKNPMNVIILDACRDNPFGTRVRTDQKGLSQFDAPPGSLLAYATAPGNVASDGEGANGLYTENLLREMRVPEAKIEDIFKRVRLHVRRRTNGQQIPWESTSLEDDFYFVPPRSVALAAEEARRERKRELALLEKRRVAEEAERKRREEQALREARAAAEEAERKRQQELAALEQKRIAEEAGRNRRRELALKEAQRLAEEAERKRREEQILAEARRAQEEAERKFKEELALREKQRLAAEAERKRREEQALLEAKRAQEEAERKYKEELAQQEKRLAQEEAERRRQQAPAVVARPDPALAGRLFEEELALWEKISASMEAGALEAYLLRYSSGRFAELAQLHFDRVLAVRGEKPVQVVSARDNPFSKGSAVADTRYRVGDSYTYRVTDLYTKLETETFTQTITKITDTEVIYDTGLVTDLLGNRLRTRDGRLFGPAQFIPLEFAVGRRWTTRFKLTHPKFGPGQVELDMRVVARETVTVPAGTFDTFRIEGRGWSTGSWGSTQVTRIAWLAPDRARRWIASEDLRGAGSKVIASEREELIAYKQS
jgi:uncharacterized caspase-like protein